jgi:hypothetical protein
MTALRKFFAADKAGSFFDISEVLCHSENQPHQKLAKSTFMA